MSEQVVHATQSTSESRSKKFSTVALDLSYYCPLECDHCLFDAGPSRPLQSMADGHVMDIIKSAAEVGSFYTISIANQEPFVQFDRLARLLEWLKANFSGYGVSLTTTAMWARSRAFTLQRLQRLKELYLDALMISVDDFHQSQRQAPLERCIVCAQVAQELGIPVTIQCIYSATSHRLDYFRAQMAPHLQPDKIQWIESAVCPSGRARKVIPESDWPQLTCMDGGCNAMEIMYVAPNGDATPCCGGGLVARGLVAGNLHEQSMASIVSAVEQDPILNSIAAHRGPAGLIKTLVEQHPTWRPRPHYTGACHACYEIMDDADLVQFLRASYETKKVDLLLTRLYMEVEHGLFVAGDDT
jgi:radical SAM family protein/iron-sulfur cluster protein